MQKDEIMQQLIGQGLAQTSDDIVRLLLPSIRIKPRPADEQSLAVGQSKMGGLPDLPAQTPWPLWKNVPLSFVAQIRLRDVTAHDVQNLLPHTGLLSFFYDPAQQVYGDNPAERDGWKVIYTKDDKVPLTRFAAPAALPANARFTASALDFSTEQTLPQRPSDHLKTLAWTEQESKSYEAFLAKYPSEADHKVSRHRMLGYPDELQDDMRIEAQFASHGVNSHDARAAALAAGAANWQLLLQVDTDERAGIHWPDAGTIYYWIEEQALRAQNFNNVWLVLQTT